ncbi:MAG TPA: carboxymuconolactone decarboxylase family protein [Streptosporangiaceae bacterium]|nr:carboxymuconolactone decarboxylase family protein [Streptosporangiaceae bacterium]
MHARLNFYDNAVAMKFAKHINSAGAVVTNSTLPAVIQELVKIRASQINGCSGCTDMHTKDAAHAGESSTRLNLIAAWRDANVFTDAERAALELTEQGTRIADAAGGVTDAAWALAAKHYDDDQLAALVSLIALINTYNRMNVISRQPAGDYQPGQWG